MQTLERQIPEKIIIRLCKKFFESCCTSCHEDQDIGYNMLNLDLGKNRSAEVCCGVMTAIEQYRKHKLSL